MRLIIQDSKHLKLKQDLLWIGTTTLVTVIIWIAYAIYSAYNQPAFDPDIEELIAPLNPSLDQETLLSLENRFIPPEPYTILVMAGEGQEQYMVPLASRDQASPSAFLPQPTPTSAPNNPFASPSAQIQNQNTTVNIGQ